MSRFKQARAYSIRNQYPNTSVISSLYIVLVISVTAGITFFSRKTIFPRASELLKQTNMDSLPSPSHGGIRIARTAIKVLAMVILLGSLVVWVVMPTTTYKQTWQSTIREKTNSKYFGRQGSNLLLFTFPILSVAALASVYLHLGKQQTSTATKRKNSMSRLKSPALTKGPLGILSYTELFFFVMFIAHLVWSFSSYLKSGVLKITQESLNEGEKLWEARLEDASLRFGLLGNICLSLLFFPVTRGSSVLALFGLTSEASIKYHIWLGHITLVFFTAHGLGYVIFWAATHQISEMITWDKTGIANVPGEIALLCGLIMWVTTIPRIRRKFFELFFYTHYLYILFMVFFMLHVPISYACIMLPGFYLFLIDRYLRFLQSRQSSRLVSARVLPCETVELNFSKNPGLSYTPLSTIFISVPSISKLQWHPFTITSSSNLEPEKLSVMIKSEGSWSKKLYEILSSPSIPERLDVSTEGPYGPVSTHFLRHDTLVMVSGGSGITPFISIIRELIFTSSSFKVKAPQLLLICSFKNSSDLTMLDLLLPVSGLPSGFPNLQLQIEAYVTRESQPTTENRPRTIWFKPKVSDAPISSVLGPNSWLCLGIIISSSFIIFLILMGAINRFYIYPIDLNTNRIYPNPSRNSISMLVICVSIVMAASIAFLKNKKQNGTQAKQIQNVDRSSPLDSPESLESHPHHSLVQATKVHYNKRPDLKKMLLECKGSSVGVLVCGPKKMRHKVATICSSSLAHNLHFESISFSW